MMTNISNNITSSIMFINILVIFLFLVDVTHGQVCTPDVCNKHGTCISTASNSFTCECDQGFVGPTCNQEIDECESSPCANNGTCTDLENGFLCNCLPEWNGTLCTESKDPCQSSPCGEFGKCIATNQPHIPYYCQCPDGQNTMFKCAEPNPCLPNPCGPGDCEITANILNGYICRCYDGTIQMTNCSTPQNPCITVPCGPLGRCLPLNAAPNGYMCMCQVDGISYTTIDTCPTTNSFCTQMSCKNGGTCIPFSVDEPSCNIGQIGSTCCQCPPNYTGLRCEREIDLCSPNPCNNNGRCLPEKDSYRCQCHDGFAGENCEVRLVSNGCSSNPCAVGICYQLNQNGPSYICICPDGTLNLSCNSTNTTRTNFLFPTMSIEPTTTTESSMIENPTKFQGVPNVNIVSAMSTCTPSARDACNGGRCVLIDTGLYACQCREGYTGAYCENNINECASNPCLGGGTCYDLVNAFACFCPDRVFRSQCNSTSSSPSLTTTSTFVPKIMRDRELLFKSDCPCRNGGLCHINPINGKLCQCSTGFTGAYCEIPISRINSIQNVCSPSYCQNGGTCQELGLGVTCICKAGFNGERCETEYFRCQGNGRYADAMNCKQGRYFECVYFGQNDLNLPNGILYSRNCPPGLWFSVLNDRCDYPNIVQC